MTNLSIKLSVENGELLVDLLKYTDQGDILISSDSIPLEDLQPPLWQPMSTFPVTNLPILIKTKLGDEVRAIQSIDPGGDGDKHNEMFWVCLEKPYPPGWHAGIIYEQDGENLPFAWRKDK